MKNGNAIQIDIPAYIVHSKDERKRSWRQIEGDLFEVFQVSKDHTTVSRIYKSAKSATPATETQHDATVFPVTLPTQDQTTENAVLTIENSVAPVAPDVAGVAKGVAETFFGAFTRTFYAADLIYYVGVLIACAGIVQSLPVVGYAVSFVYFAGAVIALVNIKTRRGFLALLPHFLMLAFVEAVGFVGHTIWANNALWSNIKALPLSIYVEKMQNGAKEWIPFYMGADVGMPFKMAVGVAVVMLVSAVYVCTVSVQNSSKSK